MGAFDFAAGSEARGLKRGVSCPTTINALALFRGHLYRLELLVHFVPMVRLSHYVFNHAECTRLYRHVAPWRSPHRKLLPGLQQRLCGLDRLVRFIDRVDMRI